MNIFNAAIESHVEWKSELKEKVEQGKHIDVKGIANCHACNLGHWIYGDGLRYNKLPSFDAVCSHHEHFHRSAAEIANISNSGEQKMAMSMFESDSDFVQSSNKLIVALMECNRELAHGVVKGVRNTGRVREPLESKKRDEVVSIQHSAPVFDALKKMVEHDIGALAVYRDEEFLGIITKTRYAQELANEGVTALTKYVSEVIEDDAIEVSPDDSIEQCMIIMTSAKQSYLPVIGDGNLVGIISLGDVIHQVTVENEHIRSQLEGYIHGCYGTVVA